MLIFSAMYVVHCLLSCLSHRVLVGSSLQPNILASCPGLANDSASGRPSTSPREGALAGALGADFRRSVSTMWLTSSARDRSH